METLTDGPRIRNLEADHDRDTYLPRNRVPDSYHCAQCGRGHAPKKLWRILNEVPLSFLCARHTAQVTGTSLTDLDENGERTITQGRHAGTRTDMIGKYVPAVLTKDGSYHPYGHIPDEARAWWQKLPMT